MRFTMKIKSLALVMALFSANTFAVGATGVIVHDAQSSIDTARQWLKEAEQWKNQLTAYKEELLSKTGIRDVQGLVQDAQGLQSDLTDVYNQGEGLYTDYVKNGKVNFSSNLQSILSKYDVSSTCKNLGYSGKAIQGCEAQFLDNLSNIDFADTIEGKLKTAQSRIGGLVNKIKNSKDPKETADAGNALALENMQFEKIKFQYQMFRDRQSDMKEYQQQLNDSEFRKSQLDADPIQFSNSDFPDVTVN